MFVENWPLKCQMVTETYLPSNLWDSSDSSESCASCDSSNSCDRSDSCDGCDSSESSDQQKISQKICHNFFFTKNKPFL